MSAAIRFLPRDVRDPSPALYLSTDIPRGEGVNGRWCARVTSVRRDLHTFIDRETAAYVMRRSPSIKARCLQDRLRADVVDEQDASADLAS